MRIVPHGLRARRLAAKPSDQIVDDLLRLFRKSHPQLIQDESRAIHAPEENHAGEPWIHPSRKLPKRIRAPVPGGTVLLVFFFSHLRSFEGVLSRHRKNLPSHGRAKSVFRAYFCAYCRVVSRCSASTRQALHNGRPQTAISALKANLPPFSSRKKRKMNGRTEGI